MRGVFLPAGFLLPTICMCFAAAGDPYNPGFTWTRSSDWIVRPSGDQGTTQGNPSNDAFGSPVWTYEWTEGGGGLLAANAWYRQAGQRMVWDAHWFSTGASGWAQADNYTPFIGDTQMSLRLVDAPPNTSPVQAPVVWWTNPSSQPLGLEISGIFTVGWQGGTTGYPVDVDLVIARKTAAGVFDVVFSTTVGKPHDDLTKEFLDVPVAGRTQVNPGDSIIYSLWSNGEMYNDWARASDANWLTLDDPISIRIVSVVPLPPAVWSGLILLAGLVLMHIHRRERVTGVS